jgi:L-asparaginase
MPVKIIATGGTFDKHYDELTGSLIFADTHLPEMLKRARVGLHCELQVLMLKDSLEMTDADREGILHACESAQEEQLIIIHGTDTMVDTAKYLAVANLAKTIVLTGAMIPYQVNRSDAMFNLGFALGIVQTLPAGIYVAMDAQIFAWDKVRKNREQGIFEIIP